MVVLREKVNAAKVSYLIDTYTFNIFKSDYEGSLADCKKDYNKLIKYLNSKRDGKEEAEYKFCNGRNDGRMYGFNSIQNVMGNVRGFLCEGITTDIDIANAHPVILHNLCKQQEIDCPYLFQYINDRENTLSRIMEADNITRTQAKKKVLVATNSNKNIKSASDFFKGYNREMKIIQDKFLLVEKYDYLKPFAKKETNFKGSFINHIMCVYENDLLQLIKKCCEDSQLIIHSLMFDGLMVYGDISDGFLKVIEEYIGKNSDFKDIKLTIKEHNTTFELPDGYTPIVRKSYKQVKDEFEKFNCKVATSFVNNKNDNNNIYSRSDFITLHEAVKYWDLEKGKDVKFINEWFEDENKREYDRLDSFPKKSLCPPSVYNLWEDYPIIKVDRSIDGDRNVKAVDFFINHIKTLCNYEDKVIAFVLKWIAQMFQYPEHKTMELVFISSEGAGKGLFLEFFKTIMGNKKVWECTDPQRDIYGNFNGMMKDAVLVCLNEANKAGIYNQNDKKKALITDNVININIKGGKNFPMNSYHRFITFTNNACPTVPNKRRDCIIRCSDDKIGNTEYFNEGFSYASDVGCCKEIYEYFMIYATSPKIVGADIPITEHHEVMMEEHKSPMRSFLETQAMRWFDDGVTDLNATPDDLYYLYHNYCLDEGLEAKKKRSFATALSFEKLDFKSVKTWDADLKKSVRIYNINIAKLKSRLGLTA